jgi:hypothetical protein
MGRLKKIAECAGLYATAGVFGATACAGLLAIIAAIVYIMAHIPTIASTFAGLEFFVVAAFIATFAISCVFCYFCVWEAQYASYKCASIDAPHEHKETLTHRSEPPQPINTQTTRNVTRRAGEEHGCARAPERVSAVLDTAAVRHNVLSLL